MPQITLEYTRHHADVDWTPVALDIHEAAVEIAAATLPACKTRLIALDTVVIADGAPQNAMVACRIGLMPGRTLETKTALSEKVLSLLQAALPAPVGPTQISTQVSTEVFDLNDTYRKLTVGG